MPVGPLYPSYPTDPDYTYFLTSYVQSAYGSGCMNIQNWYYLNSLDIFGVYDVPSMTLTTYKRNAAASEYSVYRAAAYSVFVNSDGSLRYSPGIESGWYRDTMLCSPADAGSLPFPVFASLADAKNYVATGEVVNTYVSGTVPMEVEVFREDAASLVENALSGILSFPASADLAASNMAALADTYPAGTLEDVRETVGAGGLELGDTIDIPVTGDAALSDILEAVRDLAGLDPDLCYEIVNEAGERGGKRRGYYGDELMNVGLITSDASSWESAPGQRHSCDFDSRLFILKARTAFIS